MFLQPASLFIGLFQQLLGRLGKFSPRKLHIPDSAHVALLLANKLIDAVTTTDILIRNMDFDKLPYYLFLIIRPDGNTAFSRTHQQYPLQLDVNQLLTLGSNLNNLNTMQAQIIHPDIKNNRKDQIDLAKNSSIKAINASTFQMRFLDTVSGYMFIISAGNGISSHKLDQKLDQIYKTFVDYVIKAPYFNATQKVDNPIFLKKCNEILYFA